VHKVSGRYDENALTAVRAFGLPSLQYVVVPLIYRSLDHEQASKQTDEAMEKLVQDLTTVRPDTLN
jgi:hypothetical protein